MTIASLIVDVAANSAQLTTEVKKVNDSLGSMSGFAQKAAGAIGIAFSAQAVISFGKQVFDTASEINDMSTKLGISTDAVQGFKFAAEQTGTTIDAVGTAITKMSKGLVGGDKAVAGALKEVGLNIDNIRGMSPENAFLAIADAIQRVPDPMIQSHAALTIFGKSAAELLPGMKEGFRTLADSADKMSEDTIRALDNAQDAWERLSNKVVIVTGTVIGHALDMAKQTTSSWASFMMFADNAIKHGVGTALAMADAQEKATVAAGKNRDVNLSLAPTIEKHETAVKAVTKAIEVKNVVTAEELQVLALLEKAHAHQQAAQQFEQSAYQASTRAAENYIKTLPTAIFQTRSFAGAVAQVSEAAATYQGNIERAEQKTKSFGDTLQESLSKTLDSIPQTMANAFTGGGNIMGGIKAIASQVGSNIGGVVGSMFGGPFGQKVGEAVGSLLGPLVGLFGKLFGSAGRDAVIEFAKGFGGFDSLQAKLETLGAAGAALWVKLTQGVGRNNPEQAKKVIEEINAAFAAQDAWMSRLPGLIEKYGLSWEQAGQQAKQAHLDEIAQGLIRDFADLSKAGFDVTLITEKMGTAINDYVHLAMQTGTEIPAAMRPLLEKMIEMGTLTDLNGDKITDLEGSGITFAKTLTQGFQSIVDAIHELTRALGGLPSTVDIDVNERHHRTYDGDPDPTGAERHHSGTAKVLPFVTAHRGLLPDEVPAILQTGEAVLNRRAAAAVGTHAISELNAGRRGGGGSVTVEKGAIVVNGAQDPERVAEEIMRRLRREMRLNVA